MPCQSCQNPALCTERCQAYAAELAACEAIGQMTAQQIAAHVEAGEMEAAKGDATPLPTHPQQEKL